MEYEDCKIYKRMNYIAITSASRILGTGYRGFVSSVLSNYICEVTVILQACPALYIAEER